MSIDIALDDTGFRKSGQYTAAFSQSKLQMDVITMTTFNEIRMWPISVE